MDREIRQATGCALGCWLAASALGCTSGAAPGTTSSISHTGSGGGTNTQSGGAGSGGAPTSGSGGDSGGWAVAPPDYCSICSTGTSDTIMNPELIEGSGLGGSYLHPGVFYSVNDSGDSARFFAVGSDGADLGTYALSGTTVTDCEDMAMGPCAVGKCIFIADIGDNDDLRPFVSLMRVPEPAAVGPGVHTALPTQFKFAYEDGPHNAEALLIHPLTGEKVILTRVGSGGAALAYHIPDNLTPNVIGTATAVGSLLPVQGSTSVTGGDVHPLGHGVLVRTFTHLWFYPLNGPDESIMAALARQPCAMPVQQEPQGESVAWAVSGNAYATLSEGTGLPIHLYQCQVP